eukprot:1447928-Prymnesium_polylepis.1
MARAVSPAAPSSTVLKARSVAANSDASALPYNWIPSRPPTAAAPRIVLPLTALAIGGGARWTSAAGGAAETASRGARAWWCSRADGEYADATESRPNRIVRMAAHPPVPCLIQILCASRNSSVKVTRDTMSVGVL